MGLNNFDKIIYINLDKRKDRKQKFLSQLKKQGVKAEKIHRISAIFDPLNGHRGCAKSHIKALDYAIKQKFNNVLILEDDCEFTQSNTATRSLIKYFFYTISSWDVFFLGAKLLKTQRTKYKMIKKVLKATRAHAYVVNKNYFYALKNCFDEACVNLEKEIFFKQSYEYAIDQYWHKLQAKDDWYILYTQLAKQSTSFSDIEYIEKNTQNINQSV